MSQSSSAIALDPLPPGKARRLEHQGKWYAVFNIDHQIYVIDDACPHRGGPLGAGYVEGHEVFCPLHGWAFDVRTGKCTSQSCKPVRTYPTKIENGQVWIQFPK